MKRKPKFVLPTKYILLILSGVCIVAILLSFTLGISGGPLNTVAGYVFIPMQRGINSVGSWIGEKADNLKKLRNIQVTIKLQQMLSEKTAATGLRILRLTRDLTMESKWT